MRQALAALAGSFLTVGACTAAGAMLIRWLQIKLNRVERLALAFVLGAACFHLAIFTILALHVAYRPVVIVVELALLAACARSLLDRSPSLGLSWHALLFVPFAVLAFFHAWAPEASPDGSSYHLGFVVEYLRAHGFERIATHAFSGLSAGVETLFIPAFAVGQHSAAALVHFAFALALAAAMAAYGARLGHPLAGLAAALFTFASPVVGIDGSSAYNDVAVAAIAFAAFYFLELWDENRDARLLTPIGLLAGYAFAAKYTAFVVLIFAFGFVLWKSAARLKNAAILAACAALMIAPWMLKNWIYLRNPVAPFGNAIFRNPYVHISYEQAFAERMRVYQMDDRRTLPLQVTIHGDKTAGIVGPLFLLSPIALLALRYQAGRRLMALGALLLATYFANIGTRFLIPCLPFISLAMALALSFSPGLLTILMLFHAITCWPNATRVYANQSWKLNRILFKEALRIVPADQYLRRESDSYSLARMVDDNVPKGERVFSIDEIANAYTSREIVVSYLSAEGDTLTDFYNAGWIDDRQPRFVRSFHVPETPASRIRLLADPVKNGTQQWGLHELRLYLHNIEVPRQPGWRLRAWPNPWQVQLAFDNSPATRWRTWEPAAPGMYLEVEFPQPQPVDEIREELCSDDLSIPTAVDVQTRGGAWTRIRRSEDSTRATPARIPRYATYEMHARGVNYLLLSDTNYGSDQVRGDPDFWGLKQIAAGFGYRLYKIAN